MIKAIDVGDVHRLCSAQVVVTLAGAVKELLENSMDAGATSVEVRVKDFGLTSIEVSDNGRGIEREQFDNITASHSTSKITDFSDIEFIETFGFRGEALSSLCTLSNVSITTRHSSAPVGFKLCFDHDGKLLSTTPTPRNVGTSVVIADIFKTLPVRHKDLQKNVKREFQKLVTQLQSYAMICCDKKFSCSNEVKGKARQVILQTCGSGSLPKIITTLFGVKQTDSIVKWETHPIPDESLSEFGLTEKSRDELRNVFEGCEISGFVSKVGHSCGRSSPDRQFFYINNRPCELARVSKVVNEVYRSYNSNQYPFVCLSFTLKHGNFDLNVTPDKRTIFIKHEKLISALIKYSCQNLFRTTAGDLGASISASQPSQSPQVASPGIRSFFSTSQDIKSSILESLSHFSRSEDKFCVGKTSAVTDSQTNFSQSTLPCSPCRDKENILHSLNVHDDGPVTFGKRAAEDSFEPPNKFSRFDDSVVDDDPVTIFDSQPDQRRDLDIANLSQKVEDDSRIPFHCLGKMKSLDLRRVATFLENENPADDENSKSLPARQFLAEVTDKNAESELVSVLSKQSFSQMKVIGQFNLGFIIGQLNSNLFIVDQHATDEKYNFEKLLSDYEIPSQKLISPMTMELTLPNWDNLVNNLSMFRKNGFEFNLVLPENESGCLKRVELTSIPMSRTWTFGPSDVEELLFMLHDSSSSPECNDRLRPSRVRLMFASRACRKSIMIGQALTNREMLALLRHMSEMDQPWNCPHGRPTIRHLFDINLLKS